MALLRSSLHILRVVGSAAAPLSTSVSLGRNKIRSRNLKEALTMSATLGKALRKKELKRWATEPAMGNAGTDHIAGMLAKALLQRRAQSRVSVVDCDDDEAFDEE